MILTPEFIAAEVAYRAERLTDDYPSARRSRSIRSYLHLPSRSRRNRVGARTLARG